MFQTIIHADWSVSPLKRWAVRIRREGALWRVGRPRPVLDTRTFLAELLALAEASPTLAGFDFPLGLPLAYGLRTGLGSFREALAVFGVAPGWESAYAVAETVDEVSLGRPFFPRRAVKGVRRSALVQALGLERNTDLLRLCERAGGGLRQACPVFWTLGANQVGRAAIAGWREVVGPALLAGASLWPFDGALERLAQAGGLVLVETYPADAYAQVGAGFGPRDSKRRQADRWARAGAILSWAEAAGVDLSDCRQDLENGFGPHAAGEDAFDALLGALGMILVVTGQRAALPPPGPWCARLAWEGWILGRPLPPAS